MNKFIKIKYNEIKSKKINDFDTTFIVQPLERGMSNTLGNSLRRVLLSSVSGIAPFAIQISGIKHQYETIANVNIDVISLISKLTSLSYKSNSSNVDENKIYSIHFKSTNEGQVTVKDINLSDEITIINEPNEEIAVLSKKDSLEFVLYLRYDRGFSDEDKNKEFIKLNKSDLNVILKDEVLAVDSNFSPIKLIGYSSEELNSSSYNVEEKLELNIKTDGTISGKEALQQASKILMAHLQIISDLNELDANDIFETPVAKAKEVSKYDAMTIDDLDLTVRSTNGLRRAKINKVSELIDLSEQDLRDINSIGEKSVTEIIEKLKELKIDLQEQGDE